MIIITPYPKKSIFLQWLKWHFWGFPKEFLAGWKNILVFNLQYFSIPFLLKTLFSHWRGDKESYGRGFDPATFFRALFLNLLSRAVGAFMRICLIIFGIFAEIFLLAGGIAFILFWLVLPFACLLSLTLGIAIIVG